MKMKKCREILLLTTYIVLTSISLITLKNKVQAYEMEKEVIQNVAVETEDKYEDIVEESSMQIVKPAEEQNVADVEQKIQVKGDAIAVVSIPSVGILGQIKDGVDNETMKKYVGRFPDLAMPGEYGNFCLAAHNNIYTELFRNLYKVKPGQEVKIVTRTNEYIYVIDSVQKIKPTQVEVLDQDMGKKEITLLTCTDMAKNRISVKGTLKSEKAL